MVRTGDHAGRWPGQADGGSLGHYNRVMPRRPQYQRGIKRGQICDWPDGVGTPDEVAARVTHTGNRIHKIYMSPAGPPAWHADKSKCDRYNEEHWPRLLCALRRAVRAGCGQRFPRRISDASLGLDQWGLARSPFDE